MLPLSKCRELLREEYTIPDDQLIKIRDALYPLAEMIASRFGEDFPCKKKKAVCEPMPLGEKPIEFSTALSLIPSEDHYEIEERAAILEYDARVPREEAERRALEDYLKNKSFKNN